MPTETLGLRVENGQAVRAIKDQDAALRRLAEASATLSEREVKSYASMLRSTGQAERYKQIVQQLAREKLDADAVTARLNATTLSASNAFTGATLSTGRLRSSLTSLASQAIGTNTSLGQLGNVLGSFAIGSGPMIGILLGIAAVGYAYQKLTEDSRNARQEIDKLLESLREQAGSAFAASPEGAQQLLSAARQREADAQAAVSRLNASGWAREGLHEKVEGRLLQATRDRILAERNLQSAQGDRTQQQWQDANRIYEFEKGAAADLKRIDAERAAQAKQADDAAMARLKARLDFLKNAFSGDYGGGASFGIDLAQKPILLSGLDKSEAAFRAPTPLPSGYAQTYQQRQQAEQWTRTLNGDFMMPVKHVGQEVNKVAESLRFASQSIASTATNFVIGKVAGGGIAGNLLGGIGGGVGQAAASLFPAHTFAGGGVGQAVVGPIFGSILGAFGGAVGAGVDAMFDFSGSIKAARIALENMRREVEDNIASFEARAFGTEGSVADQIRIVMAKAERQRAEILASFRAGGAGQFFHGRGNEATARRDAELARIDAAEKAYIARIKEADAIKATTEALNAFTTSVRNAPSGFKVESYINRFAEGRPWDYNGGPMGTPFSPQGGPTSTGRSISIGSISLALPNVTKPEQVGPAFMQFLDKVSASTVGRNAPIWEALEVAPRS